jgi:hypothetical protein
MPHAFIIHGQDAEPRNELARFLRSLGVNVLSFHQAASSRSSVRMILKTVLSGIKQADVVIVLFTPDEQAVFHNPRSGTYHGRPGDSKWEGWEARPNVIFEAGIAIGVAGKKTIIARLGPVRDFSDLGGIDYVDLDRDDAKEVLRDRVSDILRRPRRAIDRLAGDFRAYSRRRWPYHAELDQLERSLGSVKPYRSNRALFTMVRAYAIETPDHAWSGESLAHYIFTKFDPGNGYTADSAFWYLTIMGMLTFKGINDWDAEPWWANAVEHSILTARGRALLHKLERLAGADDERDVVNSTPDAGQAGSTARGSRGRRRPGSRATHRG